MVKKCLCLIAAIALLGGNVLCANGEEWKQVFADDFNRGGILGVDFFQGNWIVKSGKWDVARELKGSGPGALIMCASRFQVPLRVEYECSSDNPCDLSMQINSNLDKMICYVGFGCEYNTQNKIYIPGGDEVVSRQNLIEPGRRHKVVVVATETNVTQIIDGKETVKADIKFTKRGVYFGFDIWTVGAFGNVKVYSPHEALTGKVEEARSSAQAENPIREFKSFEDWPAGAIAATNCIVKCVEKSAVKIADVPTWLYFNAKSKFRGYQENEDPVWAEAWMKAATNKGSRFVSDHCVELSSEDTPGKGKAEINFPMPAMKNGMVEFDVMADSRAGGILRVRLGEKCALLIDQDGLFYWEANGQKTKLADRIQYHGIHGKARFNLQTQRWFTVRIDYDTSMSLANVAIVNMYLYDYYPDAGVHQYFQVGEDLPLPMDNVSNLAFEITGSGRFLIDNLFCISRTADLADDAKWKVAARKIMNTVYHQRKDPPDLKTLSLRNVRNAVAGTSVGDELDDLIKKPDQYPVILESARQYNRILIDQAFLAEKMRGLERAYFYLGAKSEKQALKYAERMAEVRKDTAETENLLAQLYRFYADCYLDGLNQVKMKEGFSSRYDSLKSAMEKADALIQATYADMAPKSSGKAADIACRYEPQADWDSLEFSEGSHRRNGKREYILNSGGMLWPYMHKELLFPNVGGVGLCHLLRDNTLTGFVHIKEPEMCNASTNAWYYGQCAQATNLWCSLRLDYGQHNHTSVLPLWWVEKHKSEPDLFLQNVKGEIAVPKADPKQQFNYWNPTILAAQKTLLEGMMDALAGYNLNIPKRVINIDMAQEAYYQINVAGSLWETGYNKTAVKAFQEQLKKQYGSIGVVNERWGSKYGSFDEIKPPDDYRLVPRPVPSGLAYEFERFRMKSWSDWMKQCAQWIQEKLPQKTPSSCDMAYYMLSCQDAIDGFDTVKLYETFDIVMEHAQQQFADDTSYCRYMENLRQVFKASTGNGEWYVSGPDDVFNEQACMNNGLRQTYQHIQWGRSVLSYWGQHGFYWLTGCNWTEGRLGHTVFRYFANYIPLGIARARAHQAIYLECPLVQPDVGIVESETSFYNVMGVRGGLNEFSGQLFSKSHDFGFLFERLIMDGRQKLDNYKVLILPNAFSLPVDFTQKLMAWVEKGGVLIATGPVGVWNEYGQTNGLILDKVIGQGNWTCEGRVFKLKDKLPDTGTCKVTYRKDASFLIEGQLGQGKVYLRQGSVPPEMIYGLISTNAPRLFYGEGNKFHLVMREDAKGVAGKAGALYLSLLNPDCYQTLEDEIAVKGEYKEVADISCNFPIAATIKDGYTRFKVKLAPVEGIMIRIKK